MPEVPSHLSRRLNPRCPRCGRDHAWCDPDDPCKPAWVLWQEVSRNLLTVERLLLLVVMPLAVVAFILDVLDVVL